MAKQVSSSLTLFWRVAFPTMWVSFFSVFTLAVYLTDLPFYGGIPRRTMLIGIPLFLIIGLIIFFSTILKIKRIDMDEDFVYATNYLKTYRYPWHNIEKIDINERPIFSTGVIHLVKAGTSGKKILFLLSKNRWRDLLAINAYKLGDYLGEK